MHVKYDLKETFENKVQKARVKKRRKETAFFLSKIECNWKRDAAKGEGHRVIESWLRALVYLLQDGFLPNHIHTTAGESV